MSNELQTNVTASELVECAPASVTVVGKSLTEKRQGVIAASSSLGVLAVACAMSGKIGKQSREKFALTAAALLARSVLSGNYTPVAQALALELGESVYFGSNAEAPSGETPAQFRARQREDWELFGKLLRREMAGLPKTTKTGKAAPKHARFLSALNLYTEVRAEIDAELTRREAARKEREAAAQQEPAA